MTAGGKRADLRVWLEAAISSASAALPFATASFSGNQTAVGSTKSVAELSTKAAESQAIARPAADNFKRSLVTVRRISGQGVLKRGYRLIKIDGWTVVTKESDGFYQGQYVLFFEPDSFLPATSPFSHLFAEIGTEASLNREIGYRVGTSVWTDQNEREVVSQGHVLHVDNFRTLFEKVLGLHWTHIWFRADEKFADAMRHVDFSDDLGVKKWESPQNVDNMVEDNTDNTVGDNAVEDDIIENNAVEETSLDNVALDKAAMDEPINAFPTCNPSTPSFVPKTSMERVQNCPNLFIKAKYKRFIYQESLKMDGASTTIYFILNDSLMFNSLTDLPTPSGKNNHTYLKYAVHPTGRFGVCSSNKDLLPHLLPSKTSPAHSHYWDAAIAANLHKLLPTLNESVAIQAELVGQTVQGNPYHYPKTPNGPTHELFIFSIMRFQPFGPKPGPDLPRAMVHKRWHPLRVESFAAEHGLQHVPVLGYHKLPAIAQEHGDLIARAELKKGEGLVYKCCTDGRWFKVLSERWLLEKGDEKLVRVAQAQMAKGKERAALSAETKAAVERQDARNAPAKVYSAGREETEKILAVFRDLEDWMKRDDGLRKWMGEWEKGYGRPFERDVDCTECLKRIEQVESGHGCVPMRQDVWAGGQMNGNSTAAKGSVFNSITAQHNGQIESLNTTSGGVTAVNSTTTDGSASNDVYNQDAVRQDQHAVRHTSPQNSQGKNQGNDSENSTGFEVCKSVVAWLGL